MLELARFEARRRLRGTLGLTVAIAALVLFYVAMWPAMADMDLDELFAEFPDIFLDMFGIIELGTIEGFLAAELYQFIWTLLLGLYFGYAAAGTIAGPFERKGLDVTLALPITRRRLVLETFAALLVPIVVVNVIVGTAVFASVVALGEWIDPAWLALAHVASVPYLTACVGIGLVLSVSFDRADVAQRLAIGVVFAAWAVDTVSKTVDREVLGSLSPSRYYQPSELLVLETVAWSDLLVLVVMTAVLVAVAVALFQRRDLAA